VFDKRWVFFNKLFVWVQPK